LLDAGSGEPKVSIERVAYDAGLDGDLDARDELVHQVVL